MMGHFPSHTFSIIDVVDIHIIKVDGGHYHHYNVMMGQRLDTPSLTYILAIHLHFSGLRTSCLSSSLQGDDGTSPSHTIFNLDTFHPPHNSGRTSSSVQGSDGTTRTHTSMNIYGSHPHFHCRWRESSTLHYGCWPHNHFHKLLPSPL